MIIAACLVLGAVFLLSGIVKMSATRQWLTQSADLGVPRAVAAVVPFAESAVGALLVAQFERRVVALVAAALLVAFTILLVVRLLQDRRPPCACFGVLSSKPIGWRNVVRNVVLLALAAVIVGWAG